MLQELMDEVSKDTSPSVGDNLNGKLFWCSLETTNMVTVVRAMVYARRKMVVRRRELFQALESLQGSFRDSLSSPECLIEDIEKLLSSNRIRPAIQLIFSTVNSWLCDGRLDLCRRAIDQVKPRQLGIDLSLSFLTITFAAKAKLNPSRAKLHKRLFEYISECRGPSVAENLLRNL